RAVRAGPAAVGPRVPVHDRRPDADPGRRRGVGVRPRGGGDGGDRPGGAADRPLTQHNSDERPARRNLFDESAVRRNPPRVGNQAEHLPTTVAPAPRRERRSPPAGRPTAGRSSSSTGPRRSTPPGAPRGAPPGRAGVRGSGPRRPARRGAGPRPAG